MSDHSGAKPRGGILTWALWGAAIFGVAVVLYIIAQASFKQTPSASQPAAAAHGLKAKLAAPQRPTQGPDYVFYDAAGKPLKISDFKGKVAVVNIWATWCAPCLTEMPTLARLQAAYAGKPVEVVAVSIDTPADAAKARLFIAQHGPLKFYHDRDGKLPWALKPPAAGAPTTVIYGPDGLERGRVSGEADWSAPDARAVIDEALARR